MLPKNVELYITGVFCGSKPAYEGPSQKYGEYSVVPCKALYLQGTLLAEQLRRSGPVTRPPYRLL